MRERLRKERSWAAILGVWTYKNRMASLEGNLRVPHLTSQTPMARWLDKENVEEKTGVRETESKKRISVVSASSTS